MVRFALTVCLLTVAGGLRVPAQTEADTVPAAVVGVVKAEGPVAAQAVMAGDSLREVADSVDLPVNTAFFMPGVLERLTDSLTAELGIGDTASAATGGKTKGRKRMTAKEKEAEIVERLNRRYDNGWNPIPRRATILSMIFPGGGQIYNRKYWKLPIFYGGYVGCLYALTWNNTTYNEYMQAYQDFVDDDPETTSYLDFIPSTYDIESNRSWLESVLKNRKDYYRRYRDISIFAFAGVYLLSIIDAYVDAELSHFDVSKDLSLDVSPGILDVKTNSVGVNFAFTF